MKGGPVGVAFRPNGEVWLHEDGDGSVTVVDSKTDEVVAVIPTGGTGAGRIAVSPDGAMAASTHSGSGDVALIDTASRKVVASVPLGKGPGLPAVLARQLNALRDEFGRRRCGRRSTSPAER